MHVGRGVEQRRQSCDRPPADERERDVHALGVHRPSVRTPRRFAGELAQCLLHFGRRDEREEDASGGFGSSQRRTIVGSRNVCRAPQLVKPKPQAFTDTRAPRAA
jgi:hypothetical protein